MVAAAMSTDNENIILKHFGPDVTAGSWNSGPRTRFLIEWGGEAGLSVEEIWPDGDAPENPTAADVVAAMQKEGSLDRLIDRWRLTIEGVEVEGQNVVFPS